MFGYSKCQQCGKFGMNRVFYYNGEELTPWYLCDECFKEFDDAMAEIELQMERYGICRPIEDMEDL